MMKYAFKLNNSAIARTAGLALVAVLAVSSFVGLGQADTFYQLTVNVNDQCGPVVAKITVVNGFEDGATNFTDSNGQTVFTLHAGEFYLHVSADGHTSQDTGNIDLNSDQSLTVTLERTNGNDCGGGGGGAGTHQFTVNVKDACGPVVAKITVVNGFEDGATNFTDSNGQTVFTLHAGEFYLHVSADGHTSQDTGNIDLNSDQSLTVTLERTNGGCEPLPPVTSNNAVCVSIQAPASVQVGQAFNATVVMSNTGTSTWTTAAGYKLGSQNPQDNTIWRDGRVALPNSVSPGSSATFSFSNTAPSTAGSYSFTWKMVQDGVEWFGSNCSQTIAVTSITPPPSPPPVCTATARGRVFIDQNGNGIFDGSDQAMANESALLYNPSLSGMPLVGSTKSDGNGFYSFPNLASGQWRVVHNVPSGYVRTTDDGIDFTVCPDFVHDFGIKSVIVVQQTPGTISLTKNVRDVTQGQTVFTSSTSANPGDQVEFQMKVAASNGAVNSVVLTDILPSRLNYVFGSFTIDGVQSGNNLYNVGLGNLASGQTRTVMIRATVAGSSQFSAGNTVLINTANATSSSNSVSASASIAVAVAGNICSTGTIAVTSSQSTTWFITLPNGATIAGSGTSQTLNNQALGSYSISANDISGFTKTIIPASGNLVACATLNFTIQYQPVNSSATISINKTVRNLTQGGSFAKSISANTNDQVQFQIQVTASGSLAAQNVNVTDTLPSNFNLTSGQTTFNLGTMTPGSSQTVTLSGNVNQNNFCGTNTLINTANATAFNAGTVSDSATINVTGNNCQSQSVSLNLIKQVRNLNTGNGFSNFTNASNGDRVQFQLVVTNNSGSNLTANNVRLTDNLPSGLNYISGTFQGNNYNSFGNLFGGTQYIGNLSPGQSSTVTFNATVNSLFNQTVINQATASADNASTVNAQASVYVSSVLGGNVNLVLNKRAFNQTQNVDATTVVAQSGDVILYTLTVQNTGNSPATNFVIQDDLSGVLQLSMLQDFGNATFNLGNLNLTWPIMTIPAGGSISQTFTVKVNSSFPAGSDHIMTNTYGNTVNVRVPGVLGAFIAPKTGASTTAIAWILAFVCTGLYFAVRKYRLNQV